MAFAFETIRCKLEAAIDRLSLRLAIRMGVKLAVHTGRAPLPLAFARSSGFDAAARVP